VTVLCLVEQDADGIADASLRALTLARGLAESSGDGLAAAVFLAEATRSAGLAPAGPAPEALPAAVAPDGVAPDGPAPEALPAAVAPDGVAPDGVAPDGVAPDGVAPDGVAPDGLAPDGLAPDGLAPDGLAGALGAFGVTDAYAVGSEQLTGYAPQAWARALAGLGTACGATVVMAAATDRGSEVLAHLGAITGLPVAANCVAARLSAPGVCRLVRHRWAGSLLEDAVLEASPALLTVAADSITAVPVADAGAARIRPHRPELAEGDLQVLATESAQRSAGISLATARVVVGGGRGVGGPDGFGPLEELAGLLSAAVGVSRVVTSQGWRPHRQQVGQTGTRISPELYLACGISGAIQHMAGCLSAKHIVAVNTDPDAPIMMHADYAVIGDLSQVIPALVAALRSRASSS
jgi:electron transfer flavoprotein alpha subunit